MTWRELQERIADEATRLGVSLDDLEVLGGGGGEDSWGSIVGVDVSLNHAWISLEAE